MTMRRARQQLPESEAKALLATATNGVLSLVDADGAPYGVPMSFVYDGAQTIYFHGARAGRKLDCVAGCDRASFCVVGLDEIHPERFTTYFRSVIAEGRIAVATDPAEIVAALRMLAAKYAPGAESAGEIAGALERVAILRLEIRTLTGKEAIELTRNR